MWVHGMFLIFLRLSSDPINICSVLVIFELSLFANSQLFTLDSSRFVVVTIYFIDLPVVVRLVSSAYILGVEDCKLFGKSLT